MESTADVIGQHQTLNRLPALQMRFDDFIDVGLVDIGVPNRLWVDHHHGAAGTAIQTPRLVDTHATLAVESQGFDPGFAVLPRLLRSVVGATGFAAFALVQTKKHMVLVVGVVCHAVILGGGFVGP